MASSIGTAWIQIKPSLSGVSKDIENELKGASVRGGDGVKNNLNSVFNGLGANVKSVFSGAFDQVVSTTKSLFATGIGGAIALVGSQINNAFSRADILNNFPRIMSNLNIPIEQSQKSIKTLSDRLIGLPTALDTGAQGVQRFTATTKDVNKATDWFLALNDAVLAGAAPMELQTNALEQFTQMITVGKPDMMAWRSVVSAMPAQMDQLAKSMGYVSGAAGGDLYEAFLNGQVSANDLMEHIVKLDQEGGKGITSFAQQAKNSTSGFGSAMANMKNAVTRSVTEVLNNIQGLPEAIQGVGVAIGGVISGKVSPDKAVAMVSDFFDKVGGALVAVVVKLTPVVAQSMANLVTLIADNLSQAMASPSQSTAVVNGFVNLFVAVARLGGLIAIGILPIIPVIIGKLSEELTKPENAGPVAAAMAIMLGYAVAKTVGGSLLQMVAQSASKIVATWASTLLTMSGSFVISTATMVAQAAITAGAWIAGAVATAAAWVVANAAILGVIGLIILVVVGAIAVIVANWSSIVGFFQWLWGVALNIVNGAINGIVGFFRWSWNNFVTIFSAVGGFFASVFNNAVNIVRSIFGGIIGFFQGIWNSITNIFRSVGSAIGNAISGTVRGAVNAVLTTAANIINGFIKAINGAIGIINHLPGVHIGLIGHLSVPAFATGGPVFGAGSATSDSIPAMLSNGEYVIRAAAAQDIGYRNLDALNRGENIGGDQYTFGDIVINGYDKDPRELAQEISKEIALRRSAVLG